MNDFFLYLVIVMTYSIGILGAGNVGKTLGLKWSSTGHKISFGVRDPTKYSELVKEHPNISVEKSQEIIDSHDILVLALPGRDLGQIMSSFKNLGNKKIIDATNMYGMNKLQKDFPETSFVKAFNHIGYNIMANPVIENTKTSLLYCGDDKELLDIADKLAIDCGFEPFLAGDSSFAQDLENLAILWIKLSRKIGRNFNFKLLKS